VHGHRHRVRTTRPRTPPRPDVQDAGHEQERLPSCRADGRPCIRGINGSR
jgi:hypothetical protein